MTIQKANLVIRPEKLGDLVVATPVIRSLKENFPNELLYVVVDEVYASALQNDPHIDRIIPIRWRGRYCGEHEPWREIYGKLAGSSYERAAILYYNVEQWNWLMFALRVKKVAQLGGTYSAPILGHQMVLRKHYEGRRHFSEWYLDVARALGASDENPIPTLYVSEEEKAAFQIKFPFLIDASPNIIIHPFGHGSSPNYSLSEYVKLVEKIAKETSVHIFITGGYEESKAWPDIHHPHVMTCWLGNLSVREWIVASSLVDLVVAGSTGVIHAAAAVGTRTLGLYCPYLGSHPDIWGPRGPLSATLIAPETYCKKIQPCHSTCSGTNSCDLAGGIGQEQILSQIRKILAGRIP